MSEARTQANRTLAIDTPLGDDKLLLLSMNGTEALGRLFQFELDLYSEGAPVAASDILGQNVTIRMDLIGDGSGSSDPRYFNGYISRFTLTGVDISKQDAKKIYTYRATMIPWTWFLTRVSDCRIFQDMAVPDIVEQIFRDKGFTDFKRQMSGSYRTWDYCVQYRETDFNFISRLMENEGIYYYFAHENGKHTLVMCDAPTSHSPAANYDQLHFDQPDLSSTTDAYVWDWVHGHEITPNTYALTDFDPLQPKTSLFKSVNVEHTHDPGTFEMFDYPGGYATTDDGRFYANLRIEEAEAAYVVGHGTSSARGVYVGSTFTLADHPVCDEEEYLITAASYQIHNDEMGAGLGKSGGGSYLCQVTAIPNSYEFRPPRITPKPIVQGPQTAIVVGKSGEEIWTDDYGRVKVKFHWDRDSKGDETSSCWVRVAQSWAGKKYGIIFTPRIGQEVIVDFLEGDPDRPIITGRVYNGENMPPYDLPANATVSTIKSNSSKGGEGYNEIRFEDKKDSEQVVIHAQKDMHVYVENDTYESVENDKHLVVENDMFVHVKDKQHITVDVDRCETISNDLHQSVGGKEAKEITGSKSLKVGGDVGEEFDGNHSEVVSSDYYLKASNIIIEGTSSITIKVGGSSISIGSDGIKIDTDGTFDAHSAGAGSLKADATLDVEATGAGTVKGSTLTIQAQGACNITASGAMSVQSSAVLSIQGSMVNIN